MFREVREIKPEEKLRKMAEEHEKWLNGAGSIKPESNITTEECNDFWNNLFGM